MAFRLSGRVVMQRIANPSTPVRFRPQPPYTKSFIINLIELTLKKSYEKCCC